MSKAEWDELDSQEILLLNTASSHPSAIELVLADSLLAFERLQSTLKEAKAAVIKHIPTLKQALDLAFALVLPAGAVYSGNAASLPSAIVALEDAAEAIAGGTDSRSG